MSHNHHPRDQKVSATFALLVTSDSRTPETDETGKLAKKLLLEAGHEVVEYGIVPNDSDKIKDWLSDIIGKSETQIVQSSEFSNISDDANANGNFNVFI